MSKLAVGILAAALLISGCSNGAGDGGEEELTLQVAGEAEEISVYRTLVNAYNLTEPSVPVRLIEVANKHDHLQKLSTSFAGGSPPDLFLINFREYSQFAVRGAIEPVGPLLGSEGVDLSAYYEQPLEAFTFDEELYCMPQNISSLVVYLNNDALRDAGLARPKTWDWDEFARYAAEMTRGDVDGVGLEPSLIRLAPFVWSLGGDIVDDLESPTQLTLDNPEGHAALEFIRDVALSSGPTIEEITAQDLETRFAAGKLGMFLSSRRETPVFREVQGLDWDVAPLPLAEEPASILHSDAYCISSGSASPDAAAAFIAYAVGEEGGTITALGGRTVPALRSVSESGAFLDPLQPPKNAEVFLDAIPAIRRTPVIPTWPEIEDISEEILTRFFFEGLPIQEALRELDEKTRPLFLEGTSG
jgi:multiple sugar transport system substrate-binding protein